QTCGAVRSPGPFRRRQNCKPPSNRRKGYTPSPPWGRGHRTRSDDHFAFFSYPTIALSGGAAVGDRSPDIGTLPLPLVPAPNLGIHPDAHVRTTAPGSRQSFNCVGNWSDSAALSASAVRI